MTTHTLSIIIPCFNEEKTLELCIQKVFAIQTPDIQLELLIVDDCSSDRSPAVAKKLAAQFKEIKLIVHEKNQGKGAAIRTGMQQATGDFIAIQDADLEYDPRDLTRLIQPLIENRADVVLGSRFHTSCERRILYFWHSMGNKFLTFLSNMFTDLNLTDMETCYKIFRRNKIQDITIEENRFGFEPEIVAKIAQKKLRIYEMGISYHGRTYEEGKKIGWKDGIRAFYCIFHYNAHQLPAPMQLLIYFGIGSIAALINLLTFAILFYAGITIITAAALSFIIAATANYLLCIHFLFRHKARWTAKIEIFIYAGLAILIGFIDISITYYLAHLLLRPIFAKAIASVLVFFLNFLGRKYFVFK